MLTQVAATTEIAATMNSTGEGDNELAAMGNPAMRTQGEGGVEGEKTGGAGAELGTRTKTTMNTECVLEMHVDVVLVSCCRLPRPTRKHVRCPQ